MVGGSGETILELFFKAFGIELNSKEKIFFGQNF